MKKIEQVFSILHSKSERGGKTRADGVFLKTVLTKYLWYFNEKTLTSRL